MKKLSAIFFITLFLSNIIGYRVVYFYAQKQSDKQLEASLDKDQYNETDLVTIKVPLSLPYQNDQSDFERCNGEITFNGKIYKYVKRKIADGNLILQCLPDYNKMRLKKEKDDFYKDVSSLGQRAGNKKQDNSNGSLLKSTLVDFDNCNYQSFASVSIKGLTINFSHHTALLSFMPHSSPEQPPEIA